MKRTGLFLFIFLIGFSYAARSQRTRLDSLLRANENHHKEDTAKVLLLIDLVKEYRKLRLTKERFRYTDSVTALGEKIKFLRPLAAIYNSMGLYYEGRGDYERSIASYTRAIEISESLGDRSGAAGYSLNFGTVYQLLADYPRSLALYQKAANYYLSSTGNTNDLANCYVNMGGIYLEFSNQTALALSYFNKAFVIFQDGDDKRGMAETMLSTGSAYRAATDTALARLHIDPQEKYSLGMKYYEKALDYAKNLDDSSVRAEANNAIGLLDEEQGNYDGAILNYKNALAYYSKADQKSYVAKQQLNLGRVYKKKRDASNGLTYLHLALAGGRLTKVLDIQSDANFNLSAIHESLQHFDSAYFYYQQYIVHRDSIFNTEKQKEITRRQMQFEFGVKEREYQLSQQVADGKIQQQRQEISLRNKQLELTNREKEIQKLNYLKKQSELESQKKSQTELMAREKLKAGYDKEIRDKQIDVQHVQLTSNRRLSVFLAILAVIVFAAAMFIYNSRRKTVKLARLVFEQKAALEELVEVKDKIFSVISHDLRGPMNNIIAFSSLLGNGDIGQDRLQLYMEQIKSTMDHTTSLMENVLNWSASQMKGFTPVIENVNITAVIQHALKGMEQPLLKKQISVNNTINRDTYVRGDRNMIELIVRNLVSNAIKFSKPRGTLELYETHNDKEVVLSVKDNGVGIAESKVEKINSAAGHSLESTYGTEKEKGTGLGLMLCKHFAGIMGGSITVNSKPGMGSQFNISLPAIV